MNVQLCDTIHPLNTPVLLRHGNHNVTFSCEANVEADQYTWFTDDDEMIEGATSNTPVLLLLLLV